ncbi:MAG: hypothetical protein ACI4NM_02550 [Bullifex sp.]
MSKHWHFSTVHEDTVRDGSEAHPFSSLTHLSHITLSPGDAILLERGSVFRGEFIHLENTDGITICPYGNGKRPVIETDSNGVWHQDYGTPLDSPAHRYRADVSSSVHLLDCSDIKIEGLELTNTDEGEKRDAFRMCHTGVSGVAKDRGVMRNITLHDLYIHDIKGNVYDKHLNNGGIYFTCAKPEDEDKTGPALFENIRISCCTVMDTSRWGIAVGYTYAHKAFAGTYLNRNSFDRYGNKDIIIEDCYVKRSGGDAITVMYALSPIVRRNRSDDAATEINDRVYRHPEGRSGKVAAGIWPWKCLDALFTDNDVYSTRLNQDGMAYDADSGWNTVYEHNRSTLNEGGAVMFCLEEAVGSVYRNNISDHDLGGIFSLAANPDGTIAGNTIIKKKTVPLLRKRMDDGKVMMYDNILTEEE